LRLFNRRLSEKTDENQRGINMVDLMMWLVIAALMLATAIQSIGYYQQASLTYQAKSDLAGEHSWAAARTSLDTKAPTATEMTAALLSGDLKLTNNGGVYNIGVIATTGDKYCLGVKAPNVNGNNVFYSTSDNPNNVMSDVALPAFCGTATEVTTTGTNSVETAPTSTASASPTGTATATATPTPTAPTFSVLSWSTKSTTLSSASTLGMSGDGATLITATTNGSGKPVFTHDSATTWTPAGTLPTTTMPYNSFAVSADGTKMLTSYYDGSNYSRPYTSADGGATWTARNTSGEAWGQFAMSADGTKMVATSQGSMDVWMSTDSGTTFTKLTNVTGNKVSMSADGSKIVIYSGGYGYSVSTNGGSTWAVHSSPDQVVSSTFSGDGSKLYVLTQKTLSVSTNGGTTMTAMTGLPAGGTAPTLWSNVAVSSDGSKLIASTTQSGSFIGSLYVSKDSGATWTKQAGADNNNWVAVRISSDGTKLAAINSVGSLWYGTFN